MEMVLSQDQNQLNVIIVKVMVKLDLAKGFLLFSKLALNVMEMEKLLEKHVKSVAEAERFKVTSQFQ